LFYKGNLEIRIVDPGIAIGYSLIIGNTDREKTMGYNLEVWSHQFGALVIDRKSGDLFKDILDLANEFPQRSIFVSDAEGDCVASVYKGYKDIVAVEPFRT
jgi:hypothetical protein